MWKCCRFQSNMASVYIANALVVMCLALCGTTLGQDANSRACVWASPCICSGTTVSCKNRQLRSIPEGIPLGTTSLWVRLSAFLVVLALLLLWLAFRRFKIPQVAPNELLCRDLVLIGFDKIFRGTLYLKVKYLVIYEWQFLNWVALVSPYNFTTSECL